MKLRLNQDGTVSADPVPWSINPMHPLSGKWYAEKFFGQFERRFPGEGGQGLNFFFSDELGFGISGHLWSAEFPAEFRRRKGYDLTPELPALFKDIGPRTPKIRLDYNDVLAGIRVAPPWTLDVSPWVKAGANRVEVLVCNTLANHYVSVPTRYRGSATSGLHGPVTLTTTAPAP